MSEKQVGTVSNSSAGGDDPRVVRTHCDVLAAARELLLSRGWEHVTVAHVAQHSGYARSTLYRHWPNRFDLLREAIAEHSRLSHTTPSGDLGDDLIAELGAFVEALTTTGFGHMVAAMAHMARDDTEWAQLLEATEAEGTSVLRSILTDATATGVVDRDLDIEYSLDLLLGPILHRFLFRTSDPPGGSFVTRVVEDFLAAKAGS